MSYKQYNKKKNEVIQLLNTIGENIGQDYIKERINNKIKDINEDRFTIAVFGHFSNGKSTFLNALMGYGEVFLRIAVKAYLF